MYHIYLQKYVDEVSFYGGQWEIYCPGLALHLRMDNRTRTVVPTSFKGCLPSLPDEDVDRVLNKMTVKPAHTLCRL